MGQVGFGCPVAEVRTSSPPNEFHPSWSRQCRVFYGPHLATAGMHPVALACCSPCSPRGPAEYARSRFIIRWPDVGRRIKYDRRSTAGNCYVTPGRLDFLSHGRQNGFSDGTCRAGGDESAVCRTTRDDGAAFGDRVSNNILTVEMMMGPLSGRPKEVPIHSNCLIAWMRQHHSPTAALVFYMQTTDRYQSVSSLC